MTLKYFRILNLILLCNQINPQIVLLGDVRQCIYSFKGSDSRFLTLLDIYRKLSPFPFISVDMKTSFRITKSMSLFINNCLYNGNSVINSNKENFYKPDIYYYKFNDSLFSIIDGFIQNGANPKDIFILSPSIRMLNKKYENNRRPPLVKLENDLKQKLNIPIYIPTNDSEEANEKLFENKLVFTTFHQSKGLERKFVFIYGFDKSYMEIYHKNNSNVFHCPNEIFVAVTRASERLILLSDYDKNKLPFLTNENMFCNIYYSENVSKKRKSNISSNAPIFSYSVTGFTRFLNFYKNDLEVLYEIECLQEFSSDITIKSLVNTFNGTYEDVSTINGLAIPLMFFIQKRSFRDLFPHIKSLNSLFPITENLLNSLSLSLNHCLYLSTHIQVNNNLYQFPLFQLSNSYNWITKKQINECLNRMDKLGISNNYVLEKHVCTNYIYNNVKYSIIGNIDCIDFDNRCVYEFKFMKETQLFDVSIQLGLYMFILLNNENSLYKDFTYYIYNIRTNEKYKLVIPDIYLFIEKLIEYKSKVCHFYSNEEFIFNCEKVTIGFDK